MAGPDGDRPGDPENEVRPLERWRHLRHHFLIEPSGDTPVLEWYQFEEMWVDGATEMTPWRIARMGYRYLAPAVPLTETKCRKCGAKIDEDCPIAENSPDWVAAPAIGAVPGTCDSDEGVCESCQ